MARVRRVDFYPDDWIAGTGDLSIDERGVYITACALIYSRGGPITRDHLKRQCPGHARPFNRAIERLVTLCKLIDIEDGKLSQNRCETELKHAQNRIETSRENGQKGGRVSSKNSDVTKPGGSSRAREGVASTITTNSKRENEDGGLGRSAPSAKDVAAVDQAVAQVIVALKRRGKSSIRDPEAYGAAVDATVWDAWLNNIARYAMRAFKGQAMTEACEAVEEARRAGSREATAPHIRKLLNDLDRLDRAQRIENRRGVGGVQSS